MFWDTGYSSSPHIEDFLKKEVIESFYFISFIEQYLNNEIFFPFYSKNVTLKELLNEDDILQEYKSQNKNLIQ